MVSIFCGIKIGSFFYTISFLNTENYIIIELRLSEIYYIVNKHENFMEIKMNDITFV